MSNQIISQEGYEKLQSELDYITTVKRREIADRIQKAKDMGDLSENAEYSEAKDAQAFNEGRVAELMQMLKSLTVVSNASSGGAVSMGSTVDVRSEDGRGRKFTIVSFNEADPVSGKISNESPLGRAMINKKKGDKIKVETPKGDMQYEIIDIK